jgi:hypothetical protein
MTESVGTPQQECLAEGGVKELTANVSFIRTMDGSPRRLPQWEEDFISLPDAELVEYVVRPHIFTPDKHEQTRLKVSSKIQLTARMGKLPNLVRSSNEWSAYDCAFCGQSFQLDHILIVPHHFHEDGTCTNGFTADYKCCCGRQFNTLYDANRHRLNAGCMARKRELERLVCKACEFQAYNKKQLDDHCASKQHYLKTHPDEFVCAVCDVRCRCKAEFIRHCEGKQHQFKANPDARPKLYCETCDVKCLSQKQFQTHLATRKHRAASGSRSD